MRDFAYLRARTIDEAQREAAASSVMLLGGGTTQILYFTWDFGI